MIANNIKSLRNEYYHSLIQLGNVNVVKDFLPSREYSNYSELMYGLLELLIQDLKIAEEFKNIDSDKASEFDDDIVYLQKLYEICKESVEEYNREQTDMKKQAFSQDEKVNIIFGRKPSGNIAFLKDLEKIDQNHYATILQVLEDIENDEGFGNPTRQKYLGKANDKFKGVYQQKGYQIRIIFRKLPGNIAYVEMVRVKKDTRVTRDFEEPIERTELLAKDRNDLLKKIDSGEDISDIIEENRELLDELKSRLCCETVSMGV